MASQVLVQGDAEGGGDVEVVRLADETDGGGAGVQDGGEDVVILGRPARRGWSCRRRSGWRGWPGGRAKKSLSVGFAPGQPPSI